MMRFGLGQSQSVEADWVELVFMRRKGKGERRKEKKRRRKQARRKKGWEGGERRLPVLMTAGR
jgi:hypothetical protein